MEQLYKTFKKEFGKHLFDYLILFTSGLLFLFFLKINQGNKMYSFIIALMFCFTYIIWGIYHHYKLENLHLKNVVEYILIGFTFLYLLKIILII